VSLDGKVSSFLENGPKISGLKVGPDGRFHAATQGPKKQIIAIAPDTKAITVLADNVEPNDLIVSHQGNVYFTVTGKGQVMIVDSRGSLREGARGINAPNGIALSPDQGTLLVSEYRVPTFGLIASRVTAASMPVRAKWNCAPLPANGLGRRRVNHGYSRPFLRHEPRRDPGVRPGWAAWWRYREADEQGLRQRRLCRIQPRVSLRVRLRQSLSPQAERKGHSLLSGASGASEEVIRGRGRRVEINSVWRRRRLKLLPITNPTPPVV
jgi:hypothetical protein